MTAGWINIIWSYLTRGNSLLSLAAAEAVDVIIADLCLHYFDDDEMGDIVAEIGRVLTPGGRLICRVNSDKDMNHGAGQGEEIQRGLFLKDGVKKRFFNEELIRDYFEGLEIGELREYVCTKYPKEKVIWEFECRMKVSI